MRDLSSFIDRLTKSLRTDAALKETIVAIIRELTGGELPEGAITLKEGVLTIKASPVFKTEIKLREERILGEIKRRTGATVSKVFYA